MHDGDSLGVLGDENELMTTVAKEVDRRLGGESYNRTFIATNELGGLSE
jgi:hypothetical protein